MPRNALILSAIAFAASSTAQAAPSRPLTVAITFRDIALASPDGQVQLAGRVHAVAAAFCRANAAAVVPYYLRANKRFCADAVRVRLLDAMPSEARRAYAEGKRRSARAL